nr:uncharacterized protein LOC127488247 [Oryctolagus cuniculus]
MKHGTEHYKPFRELFAWGRWGRWPTSRGTAIPVSCGEDAGWHRLLSRDGRRLPRRRLSSEHEQGAAALARPGVPALALAHSTASPRLPVPSRAPACTKNVMYIQLGDEYLPTATASSPWEAVLSPSHMNLPFTTSCTWLPVSGRSRVAIPKDMGLDQEWACDLRLAHQSFSMGYCSLELGEEPSFFPGCTLGSCRAGTAHNPFRQDGPESKEGSSHHSQS